MSKPIFEDLFKFSGRRNRKSYFLLNLSLIAMLLPILIALGVVLEILGETSPIVSSIVISLVFLLSILASWINLVTSSQRCRDWGWSGWFALALFIPFVSIIAFIALYFIKGDEGPNKYGNDPLMVSNVTHFDQQPELEPEQDNSPTLG